MDYPNECHRHKNGKWKCVDRYKNIRPLETIDLGLPFPKYVRKTKCITKGDYMEDKIKWLLEQYQNEVDKLDEDRKNEGISMSNTYRVGQIDAYNLVIADLVELLRGDE